MKLRLLLILLLIFFNIKSKAQITDVTLKKRLTIAGFCLCQTNLSELKQTNKNLSEVQLEEMDLAKGCYSQDSRFIAGKGYATNKYPGLIFQTEQESEYVSKIRLTKQFKGNLPDGNYINLENFTLKDLFKLYPAFKNKWGSRGCSDYWNFSNDTLSFYVKIDNTKKPQFPIDEAFYLNKPIEAVDFTVSCYSLKKHSEDNIFINEANDPIYFIDSIRVNKTALQNYNPEEIASVTVYKDSTAIKIIGSEAKNGLIYIETKKFARSRYWNYFKSKSPEYAQLVLSPSDSTIQYILNKKILKKNFEGDLSSVNNKTLKSITLIKRDQLIKDYNIHDKDIGIIIESDIHHKEIGILIK